MLVKFSDNYWSLMIEIDAGFTGAKMTGTVVLLFTK